MKIADLSLAIIFLAPPSPRPSPRDGAEQKGTLAMHKRKRWQYYCDHCKKNGGHAGVMRKHEGRCTANPDRSDCGMCEVGNGAHPQPVPALIEALGVGDDAGMQALRDLTEGCPACTYAAIRQADFPFTNGTWADPKHGGWEAFDFGKEKEEFWEIANDANGLGRHP